MTKTKKSRTASALARNVLKEGLTLGAFKLPVPLDAVSVFVKNRYLLSANKR